MVCALVGVPVCLAVISLGDILDCFIQIVYVLRSDASLSCSAGLIGLLDRLLSLRHQRQVSCRRRGFQSSLVQFLDVELRYLQLLLGWTHYILVFLQVRIQFSKFVIDPLQRIFYPGIQLCGMWISTVDRLLGKRPWCQFHSIFN